MPPELLAPAGQPEAGYAALHYGADAVYLGLGSFSARAEAVNFSPDELARFAAFAHSLTPRRSVYLALNTLVREDELAAAADTLLAAAEAGVDAVIVQDLGVARLVRERFAFLPLHASTQLAVHNLAGVREAARLGFRRVTMARELTLAELTAVAAETELEIEAFIHGTLCYAYSGLCLFSAIACGRSGNRGRCVYSCREAARTPAGVAHPFSLKDLALGPRVLDLARAGVASLKIEGRKKSPLYVAATVDYYRRLLDGSLDPAESGDAERRLQTIFARPWTRFFLDFRHNPAAADPDVVGHRGARVGEVDRVVPSPAGPALVFTPSMGVERHDGIQVDVPGESRPYGFPVDDLYTVGPKGRLAPAFAVPAGTEAAVALPPDAPVLSRGLPVYLSSSQEVKRSYPFPLPAAVDAAPTPLPLRAVARVEAGPTAAVTLEAAAPPLFAQINPAPLTATRRAAVAAFPARDPAGAEAAARAAVARLGGSRYRLDGWQFDNPDRLYVKPGEWNRVRREAVAALDAVYDERRRVLSAFLANAVLPEAGPPAPDRTVWSLRLESADALAGFGPDDLALADDLAIGIAPGDTPEGVTSRLGPAAGRDVRLIAPLILRDGEWEAMRRTAAAFEAAGWRRWLVGNLGALGLFSRREELDIEADWPLYMINTMAGGQLAAMGLAAATASPECTAADLAALLRWGAGRTQVLIYSDLPLFISAACAHAHLGLCRGTPGRGDCGSTGDVGVVMERGGAVTVRPTGCGSVVTGPEPFSLVPHRQRLNSMGARRLCADLRWRRHSPDAARQLWRQVRDGSLTGGTDAGFGSGAGRDG